MQRRPAVVKRGAKELLRSTPAHSIALLLTDPPHRSVDRHGGGHLRRWFRGSLTWIEIGRVLALARRRMSAEGLAMVVVNEAGLADAQAAMRRAGFVRHRLIVWDQQRPGLGSGLRHQVGYVVVGLQPGSRALRGRDLVVAASVAPEPRTATRPRSRCSSGGSSPRSPAFGAATPSSIPSVGAATCWLELSSAAPTSSQATPRPARCGWPRAV